MKMENKFEEWVDDKVSIEPPDGEEYVCCTHRDTWDTAIAARDAWWLEKLKKSIATAGEPQYALIDFFDAMRKETEER